jgi:glucose-6-phosphate isomerase
MNIQNLLENYTIPDDLPTASQVLILGTGGSCLGAQALINLNPNRLFVMFPDADPEYFYGCLDILYPEDTQVWCISKSGETMETLSQLLAVLEWIPSYKNIRCITQQGDNTLRRIAADYDIKTYDHPEHIGGRFSVFTATGLIPLHLNGMSVDKFLSGARSALDEPVQLFKKPQHVLWIYSQRLRAIGQWWAQLVAESLGKKDHLGHNHGITPLLSFGTQDQHSQLQFYLDGPQDKEFTFLIDELDPIYPPLKGPKDFYLTGKNLGQIYEAHQKATIETIKNCGHSVRTFSITDEREVGYFMMKSVQEVIEMAKEFQVNAFDQPAVEEGKKRAKAYLRV